MQSSQHLQVIRDSCSKSESEFLRPICTLYCRQSARGDSTRTVCKGVYAPFALRPRFGRGICHAHAHSLSVCLSMVLGLSGMFGGQYLVSEADNSMHNSHEVCHQHLGLPQYMPPWSVHCQWSVWIQKIILSSPLPGAPLLDR